MALEIQFTKRAAGRIQTESTTAYLRGGSEQDARVLDLSPRGARLEVPKALERGEELSIEVRHPSLAQPIHLAGEVMWCRSVPGQRHPHAGLEFRSPSDAQRRDLGRLLAVELGSRVLDGDRPVGYLALTSDDVCYLYDENLDRVAIVAPTEAGRYSVCSLGPGSSGGDDEDVDYGQALTLLDAVSRVFRLEHEPRIEPPVSA